MNSVIPVNPLTFNAKVSFYNKNIKDAKIFRKFEERTITHPELTLNQYVMSSLHEDLFGLTCDNDMCANMIWADYSNQCFKTIEENVNRLVSIFNELIEKNR